MVQTLQEFIVSLLWESQCVMTEIEISRVRDIPFSRKLGKLTLWYRAFCISGKSCHLVHTLQYLFIPGLPWLMKIQMNHASKFKSKRQYVHTESISDICVCFWRTVITRWKKQKQQNLQTSYYDEVKKLPSIPQCKTASSTIMAFDHTLY